MTTVDDQVSPGLSIVDPAACVALQCRKNPCCALPEPVVSRPAGAVAGTLEVRKGESSAAGTERGRQVDLHQHRGGHYLPDGGEVWLDGRNIAGLPRIVSRRPDRAHLPDPAAVLAMSVLDNVALAAMYAGQGCARSRPDAGGHPVAQVHAPGRQGPGASHRAEPAPAQVPRAGACAGLAAQAGATGRSPVRAHADRNA